LLLNCHVEIQNKLLGLYYTFLHGYCDELGFPSPPPPMEQVIADWAALFKPAQKQVEAIPCIRSGRGVHQPLKFGDDGLPRKPSMAPAPQDAPRRTSSGLIPSANTAGGRLRIPPSPVEQHEQSPERSPRIPQSPGFGAHLKATDFTTATVLGQTGRSPGISPSATRPNQDYFGNGNRPQAQQSGAAATYAPVMSPSGAVLAKKKPPPPPPPKRIPSTKPEEYVIALYDFPGQNEGDLRFREGDRIRIVKKTQTDQDWWEGEVHGSRGSFPANYCRPV
jgi:amphiphysin